MSIASFVVNSREIFKHDNLHVDMKFSHTSTHNNLCSLAHQFQMAVIMERKKKLPKWYCVEGMRNILFYIAKERLCKTQKESTGRH